MWEGPEGREGRRKGGKGGGREGGREGGKEGERGRENKNKGFTFTLKWGWVEFDTG